MLCFGLVGYRDNSPVGDITPTAWCAGGVCQGGTSFGDFNLTNVGDLSLDSISADATDISITIGAGQLFVGDGTYSFGNTPMLGVEGVLEVDGNVFLDAAVTIATSLDMTGGGITNAPSILSGSSTITMGATGGSNNENLIWDFETAANTVGVSSGTGATEIDLGSITLRDGHNLAEAYISAGSQAVAINAAGQNVWVEVDGCTSGELVGITHSACDFTVAVTEIYEVQYSISFSGGGGKLYETGISIDNTMHNACRTERKLGAAGDVGNTAATCIVSLTAGEVVKVEMRGTDVAVTDATVSNLNMVLHET